MQAPNTRRFSLVFGKVLATTLLVLSSSLLLAQDATFVQNTDEWLTLGGDFAHTRFSPATEITAENFKDLEVVWEWDGASFDAVSGRSTPSLIDGKLFTVAGNKRYVIAIDPKTGDTLWTYKEPETPRGASSMRGDYGKGVAFGRIDGKLVIYIVSPGFF